MLLYAVAILVSAFLLFQIEPIIAKIILPWFGGSAAVWTTCLLFFQLVLLLGYVYAHWSVRRFTPRRQAHLHIALLVRSLAALPAIPAPWWKPSGPGFPVWRILALLTATIASTFVAADDEEDDRRLDELVETVRRIEQRLEELGTS